ncbi:MAG: beta-N-acetylhexosaminidase [Sandaracinaceae bacterium]|nr:beta-N-acetylhexosaminidase [Sandaracinaceae bacterium]
MTTAASIDALAGRVLCVGFPGTSLPAALAARLREDALGGVILFKRNLGALDEVAALIESVQGASPSRTPLVAIDQEGGRVARLGSPLVKLPPMRRLGERGDAALTERCGAVLGAQLAACGINVDFAPVLDVDTNPDNPVIGDRSFGRDAETVITHALAFARGLSSAGVASCGKHFPGHGDTDLDSHLALPRIAHDRARLDRVELAPFRAARGVVPSIMTAHVVFDALDREVPATLSRRVITGLLREELGYDGVIVSDDLEMKAVFDRWGVAESAVRAIEAGCDLLLVCSRLELVDEAASALVARAREDEAFAARLADAAARVDAMRARFPAKTLRGAALLERITSAGSAALEAELA